jgi:hypothetical protein
VANRHSAQIVARARRRFDLVTIAKEQLFTQRTVSLRHVVAGRSQRPVMGQPSAVSMSSTTSDNTRGDTSPNDKG